MRSLHQVRAVALTDYADVASSFGLNPSDMLDQVGIDPLLLVDPENRLPANSVIELLEASARQSKRADFGIAMAERRSYESLGPAVPILGSQHTIREVIDTAVQLRRSFNDLVGLKLSERGPDAFIEVLMLPRFAGSQALTLLVAMAYILLKGASRETWELRAVHFRGTAPSDTTIFDRFFRVPVHFSSNLDGFECDQSIIDQQFEERPHIETVALLIGSLEERIRSLKLRGTAASAESLERLEASVAAIRERAGLPQS